MKYERTKLSEPARNEGNARYRDEHRLGTYIGKRVLEKISGTGDRPSDRKSLQDKPSDRYFAGQLTSAEAAGYSDLSDELQTKLSPSAMQAEFLVDPAESDILQIEVSGNVYYRTFPREDEQFETEVVELADTSEEARQADDETASFMPVYRRLDFRSMTLTAEIPDQDEVSPGEIIEVDLSNQISKHLQEQIQKIEDEERWPPVWRSAKLLEKEVSLAGLDDTIEQNTVDIGWNDEYEFPEQLFQQDSVEKRDSVFRELVSRICEASTAGPVIPEWNVSVQVEFTQRRQDGLLQGTLVVENTSPPNPDTSGYNAEYGRHDYDTTLFDVTANLQLQTGEFHSFTFERLEEDFRYDRSIPGHGTNCVVIRPDENRRDTLRTEYLPSYRQQRYVTRDASDFPQEPDIAFEKLADLENGGLEALDDLVGAMEYYLESHEKGYDQALKTDYSTRDTFRDSDREDFMQDREAFRREVQRCRRGVQCIRKDLEQAKKDPDYVPFVARAFELMNETFWEKVQIRDPDSDNDVEYETWYLFQLVFILRVIPDIATREDRYDDWAKVTWRKEDNDYTEPEEAKNFNGEELEALDIVDIVWFPTGGGKTEAYLGLAIFSAFFDRLRGKHYGISAWTRFPLRLLSLQQTQRIGELLMWAEQVRLREPRIADESHLPFSLGYLVGSKNTPNKLSNYVKAQYADPDDYIRTYNRYVDDRELREEKKVLPSCPVCGSDVRVRASNNHRLAHYCTADPDDCLWQQRDRSTAATYRIFADDELPIHIVDNELYRYAPTMVVGTIDKIAAVDYDRKSAHLYTGRMTHWCPDHGFASIGECTEKYACHDRYGGKSDPDERLIPLENTPMGTPYDPAPTLQIQDELHLLEETLGTFNSHFETLIDTLQRENDQQRTKIIAATATIEDYERQARDLYLRKAERFPVPGPYQRENFYATEKQTTRRQFVGVMPHGKTQINAVLDLIYYHRREIERIREELQSKNQPHALIDKLGFESIPDNEEFKKLLRLYEVSLAYTISNREKDRLYESIEGQVSNYLAREEYPTPLQRELTGDTPFDEVEGILDNLEEPPDEHGERFNVIPATNMVSHGVDVDRFNYMVFFGMPRQTAEYIQASSRAGRTHPGLVLLCFNPARERDQSHYHMFEKYHEYLDRLVEPVPLNRWSLFSVRRTLPGLLFAWILSHWNFQTDENLYFGDAVQEIARELQPEQQINGSILQSLDLEDKEHLRELLYRSYGSDSNGGLPEAFESKIDSELERALSSLENIEADMASEALNPQPLRSLRDIEEEIKFVPEGEADTNLFRVMERR